MNKMNIDCSIHISSFLANKPKGEYDEYPKPGSLNLEPGDYVFKYDYPLSTPAEFKRKLSSKTSARSILRFAARDYKRIYDLEDGKVGKTGTIPGMYNRNTSDGPYGIWGHYMGDLFFEGIYINVDKRLITFCIGS